MLPLTLSQAQFTSLPRTDGIRTPLFLRTGAFVECSAIQASKSSRGLIEDAEAKASGFRRPAQTNERARHKHADARG
jgi:hypothetical protein